ncbi:MAG: DUF2514 family protein [Sphingobium sp.]|nr:DUF2514 family protein [Sphingobium sp.]
MRGGGVKAAALRPFLPYIGVALVAALMASHWWAYSSGVDAEKGRWEIVQAREAVDRAAQTEANRKESERRYAAQQEITNNAIQERDKARADADAAVDAGVRLRAAIRDVTTTSAAGDTGAALCSPATGTTGDLLERVQQRLDAAAEQLARYADDASTAGRACEASYDALMGGFVIN